uniref:phosphopyruvate hydratase n=1 Tax=Strombidium rassoulzadegani TaxID=1082188 RepID=A0A7S3CTF5_9SPIT
MLSKVSGQFAKKHAAFNTSARGFSTIAQVKAREILDSRGNPTVEADVILTNGALYRAAVPSGASTGVYEALELRDKDANRYLGKGCLKAVNNVHNLISPALKGMDVTKQELIDRKMVEEVDGTQNQWGWCKEKVGANAILAVSLAVARAGAAETNVPLYKYLAQLAGKPTDKFVMPVPSLNIINGGAHAGNELEMQEFMILPTGANSFKESIRMGVEVYHSLKSLLKKKFGLSAANVGDEGGFGAPQIRDENHTLEIIMEALKNSGHEGKVDIGLDVAASEFYDAKNKTYNFSQKTGRNDRILTSDETVQLYKKLCDNYPLVSIEDPFDQDDFESYVKMTALMGDKVQIVGDDLLVTNPKRVQAGIDQKLCNALLLKVNQIGSVTESIEASNMSQAAGWGVMVSHRSGETEDNFIGDLVCGLGTGEIKSGAPCRSDRLAKYNQILRIEEELGSKAVFAGKNFRNPAKLF